MLLPDRQTISRFRERKTISNTTIQQGTIEHIDPTTAAIETNARPRAPLTNNFINSIRDKRVSTPVLARKDGKGNVLGRAG